MSTLQQFSDFLEQPKIRPLGESTPIPATFWGLSTEQPGPSAQTSAFKFIQWETASEQASPHLSDPDWETSFVTQYRDAMAAIDEQIRLVEHLRPAEIPREFHSLQSEGRHLVILRDLAPNELEQAYVFDDRSAIDSFVERNRVRRLLIEAREPLNDAFGEGAVMKLTLLEDDEGFTTLFCLVLVPGDMQEARRALRSFDQRWWLARSAQAGGKLNFDFELV